MKRGTIEHPKTEELATELGIPLLHAVGILESLWHWAAKYARDGALRAFQPRTIAKGIHWDGDADALLAALVSCRWLDETEAHGLVIHDWHEHAEESVKKTLANNGQRFWNGRKPFAKRSRNGRETVAIISTLPKPKPKPKPKPSSKSIAAGEPPPAPAEAGQRTAEAGAAEAKPPKPRDELFDAVCDVTGSDPKVSGSHVGKVCKALRSADPPYTADEVRRWGELVVAEGWCSGKPPLGHVEKRIGTIRDKAHVEAVQRGPPGRNGHHVEESIIAKIKREQGIA